MLALAGTQIHHYRLQRSLGQGGMSEVYLAYDEQLRRKVAIKLVERNQPEYFERFQREVAMIGSLKHEHILPVFAYGEWASWCYLVMPYLECGTLYDRLKTKGPLTQKEAGKLLEQIAGALHCAHEHGILHRDVKSSNILMRDDAYIYLADFGLAKLQTGVSDLSMPGHLMGTAQYLAPELYAYLADFSPTKLQMGGTDLTLTGYIMGTLEYLAPELQKQPATPGSDIYALGILLYEMLTGQVPFHGSTAEAICWQHLHEQPVRPSLFQPKITPAVDRVVLQALAKDPRQRFQTPQALAQAYQQAIKPVSSPLVTVKATASSQPSSKPASSSLVTVKATSSSRPSSNTVHSTKPSGLWQRLPWGLRLGLPLVVLLLLLFPGITEFRSHKGNDHSSCNKVTLSNTITRDHSNCPTRPHARRDSKHSLALSPPWQPQAVYDIGDIVTYNGTTYICIRQPQTSQEKESSPPGSALWEQVSAPNVSKN